MHSLRQLASKKIQELADLIENQDLDLEIDCQTDELLITDSQHRHFLFNYHGVTQQIWFSSAISGAHHFTYKNDHWVCTRTAQPFDKLVLQELSEAFNISTLLMNVSSNHA